MSLHDYLKQAIDWSAQPTKTKAMKGLKYQELNINLLTSVGLEGVSKVEFKTVRNIRKF